MITEDSKSFKLAVFIVDTKYMVALTREEKEKLVLDLYYNQNKNYRQIAKEAKICPRDIKTIVDKPVKEMELKQSMSVSSKAYKLFSEGKTPIDDFRSFDTFTFDNMIWYSYCAILYLCCLDHKRFCLAKSIIFMVIPSSLSSGYLFSVRIS